MYAYDASLFYVCCSDYVGVCVNVCCVTAVVENSGVLSIPSPFLSVMNILSVDLKFCHIRFYTL